MAYTDTDKPLKLLHIALVHGGGVEIYTRMLIEHTYQHCDTVLICAPEYNTELLPDHACVVYREDVPREVAPLKDIKAARRIRKIIKKEQPDVVYCHSSMSGAVGRIAARGLGCKVIYNPHGWSFDMAVSAKKKHFYTMLERRMAKTTDRIVTISEYEKQVALQNGICEENKIQVIRNGIDLNKCSSAHADRAAYGYADSDFLVGCCARISDQKDPLLFARVAGCIAARCPDARFLWIGDGELKDELIEGLKENNVFDKTLITGWVADPYSYLSLLDVAVLFSKWEGFGLCLAEYLAMGKPVVATDVGAVSEIVEDGVCGSLTADRDAQKLAGMVLAYREPQDPEQLRKQCIARAKLFDCRLTAQRTVDLLYSII